MKKALKTTLIIAICIMLAAGGIFGYAAYTRSQPVTAVAAGEYMLFYDPQTTYLYGVAASTGSVSITKEASRKVLEVYVTKGDTVKAGDPIVRYDTEKDALTLEEKQLELMKLQDTLKDEYALYKKYAGTAYESTLPTPTPTPAANSTLSSGAGSSDTAVLSPVYLNKITSITKDIVGPTGGSGSTGDPYTYSMTDTDEIPTAIFKSLIEKAAEEGASRSALFRGKTVTILATADPTGSLSFTLTVADAGGKTDLSGPTKGNGTESDPYRYTFGSGSMVTSSFIKEKQELAAVRKAPVYVVLANSLFETTLVITEEGTISLKTKLIPPTPTPTITPEVTPAPDESPTPEPTAVPYSGGLSKSEKAELARSTRIQIEKDEITYRQLSLDILKLQMADPDGIVYAESDGIVTTVNSDPTSAADGTVLVEVSGGTGIYIACVIGELEMKNYPVGTQLTGYSYQGCCTVECEVAEIGTMPVSESYSNNSNPNSSGYIMKLNVVGDYTPSIGEYIDFSSDTGVTTTESAVYLNAGFISEEDGQNYIYVVRNGIVCREQVTTGRRAYGYVELVGSDLTETDGIVFPGSQNCRDGAKSDYDSGSATSDAEDETYDTVTDDIDEIYTVDENGAVG